MMNMQYKYGVAVSCHNRNEMAIETIKKWKVMLPNDCKFIVVDDASVEPIPNADYRFEKNAGIAKVKNKCLELLENCEHIFLSDDDVYPLIKDWYKAYIESGKKHLMFTFNVHKDGGLNGHKLIKTENGYSEFTHPCGCMMYIHRSVLDVVGGFDERYRKYGHEHVDFSNRVFNNRLTDVKYEDIANSIDIFYSLDWSKETRSSVKNKRAHINVNNKLIAEQRKSKAFMPYKPLKTAIITTFFTNVSDPQRETNWEADITKLRSLINSIKGHKLIVIHDCFNEKNTEEIEFLKVETKFNPYFQRWISIYECLKAADLDYVFCVDATDVTMQISPFNEMSDNKLYVGDELQVVSNKWLINNHNHEIFKQFYASKANRTLLNAGLIGGSKGMMLKFLEMMTELFYETKGENQLCDMAMLNYICYEKLGRENIIHGSKVNTKFKKYEKQNPVTSWFKHK